MKINTNTFIKHRATENTENEKYFFEILELISKGLASLNCRLAGLVGFGIQITERRRSQIQIAF